MVRRTTNERIDRLTTETISRVIRAVGIITFIVGGVVFVVLLYWFSKSTEWSRGELTLQEFTIALLAAFYHLVLGLLCLGTAEILSSLMSVPSTTPAETEDSTSEILAERPCGRCGTKNPSNFEFCWKCGAAIESIDREKEDEHKEYTCSVCGADLERNQKYCVKCGAEIKWDES
jgi:ribosomal protein L40E